MAHITGGGIPGNLNRILGAHDAEVEVDAWDPAGLFRLLVDGGGLEREEAYKAFNMGIGMIVLVEPGEADALIGGVHGLERIGQVYPAPPHHGVGTTGQGQDHRW